MDLDLALVLGLLQGFTEFFPVSSSGHLALFGFWFGLKEPDLTFDILVHLATLGAIIVYFRKDWIQLGRHLFQGEHGDFPKGIGTFLLISIIPAGLVGIFLEDGVAWVHGKPFWVGLCLLATGVILLGGLFIRREGLPLKRLGLGVVVAMSLAQALAILPGISRSGITIMVAVYLGMQRGAGARFSFLMAVPIIGGAGILALKDLLQASAHLTSEVILAYGGGFLAALVSGFVALALLMKLLEGVRFFYFGFYCMTLGLVAMVV